MKKIRPETLSISDFTIGIGTCYASANIVATVKNIRSCNEAQHIRIILVADTLPITKPIKDTLIQMGVEVIENKQRKSFFQKAKQIVSLVKTDMFILTQDDVRFDPKVFTEILNYYKSNPSTTFSVTKVDCNKSTNFFERILAVGTKVGLRTMEKWNNYHNYLAANGRCIIAPTNDWNEIIFPPTLVNGDAYIYYSTVLSGKKFGYISHATTYLSNPATLHDYLKKADRFTYSKEEMLSHFPQATAKLHTAYAIPKMAIIKSFMKTFMENPFYSLVYAFLRTILTLRKPNDAVRKNTIWEAEISTKIVK